jgi:hypothetical protein
MRSPARKLLLHIIISLLTATAVLGVVSVLWSGLGETGVRILVSAAAADAACLLALCCTGTAASAGHRAVQVTGVLSACSGLAAGLYLTWSGTAADGGFDEGVVRAAVVLWILAVAAAHTALVLPRRPRARYGLVIVAGTVLCTCAAAELIANYALFYGFAPGPGYHRALTVLLILDALGTIVIVLLHRSGPSGPADREARSRRVPTPAA